MANKVYNLSGGLYSGDAFTAFETQLASSKGGNLVASPSDLKVSAGTGTNLSISAGSAIIGNGTNSGIRVGSDATNTVTVNAASTANPRKDVVVMYIDNSVAPSTNVTDNTDLGILKFKVVAGSPAASPVAPTASAIQSSIGAGNPYMVLANVTVPKSATAASSFTIEDARILPASLIPDSSIRGSQLADGSVTSSKIDWTTSIVTTTFNGSNVAVNVSVNLITLPAGKWLVLAGIPVSGTTAGYYLFSLDGGKLYLYQNLPSLEGGCREVLPISYVVESSSATTVTISCPNKAVEYTKAPITAIRIG